MNNLKIIDPKEDKRWDDFVISNRYGSIYHLSGWSEILKNTFSYKPHYLILEEEGHITAGLPLMKINSWLTGKRLVSLPRTSYCDPLVENTKDLDTLLHTAMKMVDEEKLDYVEIKTQHNEMLLNRKELKFYKHFKNHILSIENTEEELWKSFHRTCVRQPINRAKKYNVKIKEGKSEDDLKIFHTLLNMTSKKHGVPTRPYSFFHNIWETFRPLNMVIIMIAYIEGTAAAASLSFLFKDTIYYEFLGLDDTLLNKSPGHLLLWETLRKAKERNISNFDFGLTSPTNQGLIDFKRRWGSSEKDLIYFYFPDVTGYRSFIKNAEAYDESAKTILDKPKSEIKQLVGSKLYKHFG